MFAMFAATPGERDPVSFVQEAGWGPEPVWTGTGNFALHRGGGGGGYPRTGPGVVSRYTD
jgi:hypothetical protein